MPATYPIEPPTFAQAMDLERLSSAEEKYMGTFPALSYDYAPGNPLSTQRSYGGHAFAQAIWAASVTLKDTGLFVHEANGYWTQAGHANRPFIFEVATLSETRSFVLRQVTARQPTSSSDECPFPITDASKELGPVAFALTCSFKRRETGPKYWANFDSEKYGDIWKSDPTSYPAETYVPGPKAVGFIKLASFPSIEVRTPDLAEYSKRNPGTAHRRLHIYRAGDESITRLDPNLAAAAHAFVSDRAGLNVIVHSFGVKELGVAGSLNHKIIFHVNPEELAIDDKTWFIQEMSSTRGGEGRAVINSQIWGRSGELVATTMQDALFRNPRKTKLS